MVYLVFFPRALIERDCKCFYGTEPNKTQCTLISHSHPLIIIYEQKYYLKIIFIVFLSVLSFQLSFGAGSVNVFCICNCGQALSRCCHVVRIWFFFFKRWRWFNRTSIFWCTFIGNINALI